MVVTSVGMSPVSDATCEQHRDISNGTCIRAWRGCWPSTHCSRLCKVEAGPYKWSGQQNTGQGGQGDARRLEARCIYRYPTVSEERPSEGEPMRERVAPQGCGRWLVI